MRTPLRVRLRSPAAYWSLVAVLAVGTIVWIERAERDLARRATALGPTTQVAVVVGDHAGGEQLDDADVELRDVPRSAVPADALTAAPHDRRLRTDVRAGEVLTSGRFAAGGRSEIAAQIPPGRQAIAVPRTSAALDLRPGDQVALLGLGSSGASEVIVDDGLVVAATEGATTIAVPLGDVGDMADAVLAGTMTVVLSGSG